MGTATFTLLLLTDVFALSQSLIYHYVNQNVTWFEAQSICRGIFTDLATVSSMSDMNRLIQVVPDDSGSVWIGLRRNWAWSSGEIVSAYSNWKWFNPNEGNAQASCAVLTHAGWQDWYCSSTYPFVCYDGNQATDIYPTDLHPPPASVHFNALILMTNGTAQGCGALDTATSSSRFIVQTSVVTWIDALAYCRQQYTDLATFSSSDEELQVLNLLSAMNITSAWIGLISSQWSDTALTTFRYWADDQPGEGTLLNGCAASTSNNSGMWNYSDCAVQNHFICYGSNLQVTQNRLYHFVNKPLMWSQAQLYCRGRFAALATADRVGDVASMMNAVNLLYNGSVWIGLSTSSRARWAWSSRDALLLDFNNWAAGRPNGTGSCGVSVRGVWSDYNCTTPLYFVCFQAGVGYVGVNISKSWQDAQSYCRQQYTDLATIRSPWQQKLLTAVFGRALAVWIGLFLDTWQWSDQWSLFFRNWAVGQPIPIAGNCITMKTNDSGKWTNVPCNMKYPFMCYGDVDKLRRKQIISVNVSSDGAADVNSPTLKATMLNGIQQALKIKALDKNAGVSWIKGSSGKVFVQKPNVIQTNEGC